MLALDPNETFEAWPRTEDGTGAVFVFRYLTAREWRKVNRLAGDFEAMQKLTAEEVLDRLCEALRVNLVGWRIRAREGDEVAGIPFDPSRLEDVCTISELWDLFDAARRQSRLGGPEKNASGSPSPSDTGASAKPAATDAPTDPPPLNPQSLSAPPAAGPGASTVPRA